jgi:lysophospholipase L1-like esterase
MKNRLLLRSWAAFGLLFVFGFFFANTAFGFTVVMLGDSLTAGNDWSKLDDEARIKAQILNFGIVGDGCQDIIDRLDSVIEAQPDLVFVQVGINDLGRGLTPREIVSGHQTIWRSLKEKTGAKVVVCSLLPVNEGFFGGHRYVNNWWVKKVNDLLAQSAKNENLDFIDLFSVLADADQKLPEEFTADGIHLRPKAYLNWQNALSSYF